MKRARSVITAVGVLLAALIVSGVAFGVHERNARHEELLRIFIAHGVGHGVTSDEISETLREMASEGMKVTQLRRMAHQSMDHPTVCVAGVPIRLVNTICRLDATGNLVQLPATDNRLVFVDTSPAVASGVR